MFFMTGQFTELRQLTKETEVRSVLSSINFIVILTTPSTTPKQIIRTYTDTANTIHVYKPPFGQFNNQNSSQVYFTNETIDGLTFWVQKNHENRPFMEYDDQNFDQN